MDKQLSPGGPPDRQRHGQHKIIMRPESFTFTKRPAAAIDAGGAEILQLGAQDRSVAQLLLDLQPAILQQGLHLTNEDRLGDVVNAALVNECVPYGVQAMKQIRDGTANAGQVEHQLRAAANAQRLLS
jgi:hypothetical protein